MATEATGQSFEAAEERVLDVIRKLAEEVGGGRAARAVAPQASLDRDIGLGSLEKVELLVRLEAAFGRTFDDRYLALDTPREFARLLVNGGIAPDTAAAAPAATPLEPATPAARVHTIHE